MVMEQEASMSPTATFAQLFEQLSMIEWLSAKVVSDFMHISFVESKHTDKR